MSAEIVGRRLPFAKRKAIPVEFHLRTQQVEYLEHLAERWEVKVSGVLRRLIERKIAAVISNVQPPPKELRKNLTLHPKQLAFVDEQAARTGLSRSDIVRRIVNEALATDVTGNQHVGIEFLTLAEAPSG